MSIKQLSAALAAFAASCSALAETNSVEAAGGSSEAPSGWNWAMGEGVTFDETPVVTTELGLSFDSKYLTYGLADNNDPIWNVSGSMTFFDWVTIGSYAIFDMSRYGIDAGYKNRGGKVTEYHPTVNIGHAFGPDDFAWLPTTVEFSFGYDYEYHPRVCTGAQVIDGEYVNGEPRGGDSHFWTFELTLPDLWLEPYFLYERDAMRDHGTYLQLELGHTFAIIDGEGEDDDPVLSIRPSIAQGWGNSQRVCAYLYDEEGEVDHAGLMDTNVKGELTWNICSGVTLSGYVAYSDYLFDPSMQDYATRYEATGCWEYSWHFVTGVALTVAF